MKRLILLICCVAVSISTVHGQRKDFSTTPHRISAIIPNGWDEVEGIRDNTVLKLARAGKSSQTARISLVLDDIPNGRMDANYDIWTMSNDDIRKAIERGARRGESVTVIDMGRSSIDGVHVVWNKNRRQIPEAELWEFVYEGVLGSHYLTIRLISYGDKNWYASNQSFFSDFVRSLRLR